MSSSLPIFFLIEDVDYKFKHQGRIKKWLKHIIEQEGGKLSYINIILCSDSFLYEINLNYLNHDTLTDIITFYYNEAEAPIEGELYISLDRVKENAEVYQVPIETELHRIIVHGTLHLLGYGDKTPEEKGEMTEKENFYLANFEAE